MNMISDFSTKFSHTICNFPFTTVEIPDKNVMIIMSPDGTHIKSFFGTPLCTQTMR